MNPYEYPNAVDASLVGTYAAVAGAGGGYVWDDVLEYRVWCHPERGAPDLEEGNDYYFSYVTYIEAATASQNLRGAEEPLALVLQNEYIEETEPGEYRHVRDVRVTEWPVEFLRRPGELQIRSRTSYLLMPPQTVLKYCEDLQNLLADAAFASDKGREFNRLTKPPNHQKSVCLRSPEIASAACEPPRSALLPRAWGT